MNIMMDSSYMTIPNLRRVARSPFIIAINLVQPILWMFLFSTVFTNIVKIPGFGTDSYINFLSPGIVVMSAMTAGSYAGMGDRKSTRLNSSHVSISYAVSCLEKE